MHLTGQKIVCCSNISMVLDKIDIWRSVGDIIGYLLIYLLEKKDVLEYDLIHKYNALNYIIICDMCTQTWT